MSKCRRQFAFCLIVILTFALATAGQRTLAQTSPVRSATIQPHPVNLDFEQGGAGQLPEGWVSPTQTNYAAELTGEQPKSGESAALLHSLPGATDAPAEFGNLMQAIDATAFRGRRVRFRAAVRVEASEPGARAQLWLRVDRLSHRRACH